MRPLCLLPLLSTTNALALPPSFTIAISLPNLPQVPFLNMPSPTGDTPRQPSVSLADILGTQRSLTTFSSMLRASSPLESLLSDLSSNTTVLAPLNSVIDNMPHKPWESPNDYSTLGADAYEGDEGRQRADENMQRFVEGHLVGKSPWKEGEKVKTVAGREVWWETKEGKRVIMPDEVVVDKVASQVANGELWIIKGVLKYLE